MSYQKHILYRLFPLLLLIFIDSFSFFVIIPVLLKIFYHNHYDLVPATAPLLERNALTGFMIALSMFAALLFAPIIGRISDELGRKKTLLYCVGFVFLGFLLPMLGIMQRNIYLIFIGRFISGMGSASQPVAQAAVADLCEGDQKAIYLSMIAFMMTLALVVAPLVGGILSDAHVEPYFHAITPFQFSLLLTAVSFLLILFYFKETIQIRHRPESIGFLKTMFGLPRLIKRYDIMALCVLFLGLELAWSQYYQSIDFILKFKWHLSIEHISVFSALMGVAMALGLLALYPILLKRFSVKKIFRYCAIMLVISLVLCAFLPILWTQWVFASVLALTTGIVYVSLVALMSNRVDGSHQGLLMGYLSTLLYFSWMLTAFDTGALMNVNKNLPLYVSVIFFVAALLFSYRKGVSEE